jgi:hypothetical protein
MHIITFSELVGSPRTLHLCSIMIAPTRLIAIRLDSLFDHQHGYNVDFDNFT